MTTHGGENCQSSEPSRWNLWARFCNFRWHSSSGTSTPRNPYRNDIDGLDGRNDSRLQTPNPSVLDLSQTNPADPSWQRVFKFSVPRCSTLKSYMAQNVLKDNFLTLQLSLLTIVTGVLDAATYTNYHVFTTKQTGNMLFLAVYIMDPGKLGPKVEVNVGISIGSFILGGAIFGYLANIFRPKRRAWIMVSLSAQIVLTAVASAVQHWHPQKDYGTAAYVVVALLAFSSAGQIAIAVGVGEPSLNTVMITGAVVQLTADSKILKKDNSGRNSRIGFILLYIAGCFIGAASHGLNASLPFLIAACLKLGILPSFLYNRGCDPVVQGEDVEKKPTEKKPQRQDRFDSTASTLAAPAAPWGMH